MEEASERGTALLIEYGAHKTVQARFWPWLQSSFLKSSSGSLFALYTRNPAGVSDLADTSSTRPMTAIALRHAESWKAASIGYLPSLQLFSNLTDKTSSTQEPWRGLFKINFPASQWFLKGRSPFKALLNESAPSNTLAWHPSSCFQS